MSKVWALFSDGTASLVAINEITCDSGERLTLKGVGLNPKVKVSGEKGIRAAFDALKNKGLAQNGSYGFSYEFRGNDTVTQASASLAFAVKLAQKIANIETPIAATGVVLESAEESPVEKVNDIKEKIEGALSVLPVGGIILYPMKNQCHIDANTETKALNKGVRLQAVDTVAAAVDAVLSLSEDKKKVAPGRPYGARKKNPHWVVVSAVFIFLGVAAAVGISAFSDVIGFVNPIREPPSSVSTDTDVISTGPEKQPKTPRYVKPKSINPVDTAASQSLPRFKIELAGGDPLAVSTMSEALSGEIKKVGKIVDGGRFDARLEGTVHVRRWEEIPMRPYAADKDILVIVDMELNDCVLTYDNGGRHYIGTFIATAEQTKDQKAILFRDAARAIARKINLSKRSARVEADTIGGKQQ